MAADENAARKARADRLRGQVDQLKKAGDEDTPAEEEKPAGKQESPRDFIHRRMREIDPQKRG